MGLLDALNTDEARLGLGLLAAGGYSPTPMSFGQRIQSAMQGQDAQKRGALQNRLLQSQVDENASQAQLRQQQIALAQRKQELDAQFMGGGLLGSAPTTSGAGAFSSAAAGPVAPGGQTAPAGGFTAQQISQQFGIPYEAVIADYKFNGGKKIAELISERTKPNWQNVNGNLVNTSAPGFQGGMQGGMASSADGKVTAWQPDGRGGLVVGAPEGALDTFRAYQGASADFKPIKVFNKVEQRDDWSSEGAVVRSATTPNRGEAGMRADAQGPMGPDPAGIQREIQAVQNDLATKPLDPSSRAQLTAHLADLQKAAVVTPMPAGGVAAGPSAAEAAASKAAEARAVDTAKADVVRDSGKSADAKRGQQIGEIAKMAMSLLDQNPTGSGTGAIADAVANFVGIPLKGSTPAQQLEALSGWMVANVPRMEGPQSNIDVLNYATMAGRVGDRTLPVESRKAALETMVGLQQKYAEINGGAPAVATIKPKATNFKDAGYASESAAIKDAQNAIMRGASRAAVQKRLQDMGLSLPSGAQGGW